MPRPEQRSRSRRRVIRSLPGGRKSIRYRRRVNSSPVCACCGQLISGIPLLSTSGICKLNRSQRSISRPYGSQLCSNCLKEALKYAARTP
ncbi:50S ribosomal protein L34e [Candidatus Bathyarchaeota archaeon]|nr:50S ribosomal protein L34e [Candidatus Bathyarchaeota archaeon]